MSVDQALQLLVTGLAIGSAFSIGALGFAFTYRVTGYVNFAQGHFLMFGGAIAIFLTRTLGFPVLPSVVLASLGVGLVGVLMDLFVVQRIGSRDRHTVGIATLGIALVLQGAALPLVGRDPRFLPSLVGGRNFELGGVRLPADGLLLFLVTVGSFLGLWAFLRFTWQGRAMLATAEHREGSWLQGIQVWRVEASAFGLAGLLGGLGGALVSPMFATHYAGGITLAVAAFTAATIGGLTSVEGALLGGLLVGVVTAFSSYLLGGEASVIATIALMVLVLVARPTGLFGARNVRVDI